MLKRMVVIVAALLAGGAAAAAQDFQNRPVTMVVPYPAGGVTDSMARLIGEKMQAALDRTIVIENVGGAQGVIGVGRVARAAPDGHTIILGNLETNLTNAVTQQLPFDVFSDFEPVVLLPSYPFLLVSKNDVPAKNLRELIAWMKDKQPRPLQGTVGGTGAAQHLCGLRLQKQLGFDWSFVPYRGGAPAMQDLLAGQYDIMCTATGSFLPLALAGQIRAYAVTAEKRLSAAPDIPTVDEAGLPGFHVGVWNAIWAPKGTPKALVDKLADAAVKAMNDETLRKRIIDMGLEMPAADQMTPAYLAAFMKSEADIWWPITRQAVESAAKQ